MANNLSLNVTTMVAFANLLEKLHELEYMHWNGDCYAAVGFTTPEYHGIDMSMHSKLWYRVCSIQDFVTSNLKGADKADTVAAALQAVDNDLFPQLKSFNRHLFAFRNGALDIKESVFYPYPYPCNVACMNYYPDIDFNEAALNLDSNIPTPVFDSIFQRQGITGEALQWAHILMGRLLFPLNQQEQWAVAPCFQGESPTGKTVLAKLLQDIFPLEVVGRLNSNFEEQFGQALLDKVVWVYQHYSDAKEANWTQVLPLVRGGPMTVDRRGQDSVTVDWSAPGLVVSIAEVDVPEDFVVFHFKSPVPDEEINPDLGNALRAELGSLIPKFTSLYLIAAEKYQHCKGPEALRAMLSHYFDQ